MLIAMGCGHTFDVCFVPYRRSVGFVCEWHRGTYDVFTVYIYIPELKWNM